MGGSGRGGVRLVGVMVELCGAMCGAMCGET